MADPVSLQIMNSLLSRLYAIEMSNGYNTDVGKNAELGIRKLTAAETGSCGIVFLYDLADQLDEPLSAYCGVDGISMTANAEAYIEFGRENSTRLLHQVSQDLRKALFLADDPTLGGLAVQVARGPRSVVYPQTGGEMIAVQQQVVVRYQETYGDP